MFKRIIFLSIVLSFLACSSEKDSSFYQGALGLGTPKILVASSNGGNYAVAMYDISGNYLSTVKNYNIYDARPRGIAALNGREFVVALDRVDELEVVDIATGLERVIYHTAVNGNVYQLERHPTHGIFVIDSNTVESFDEAGNRIGSPRINTNTGGCTISTPRGLAFDPQGRLLVTSIGNDDILMYDVSDPLNTQCVVANTSMGNLNPVAIMVHSNGNIYVATQGNDSIYIFPSDLTGNGTIIFNDTSIINNPTALLELPNGNILVASDATNAIVEIAADGTLVNANFINDSFTNSAEDMTIIYEGL